MTTIVARGLRALLVLLTGVATVASATPAEDAAAIDFALAARGLFVERASELQQILPRDLRTRVLLSLSSAVTDAGRTLILEDDRDLASLVEQARGSTDPIVLSRLAQRCRAGGATGKVCDALQMAQRWVDADTQNQAAWLMLGNIQRQRKDEGAAKATFLRASRASVWRDYYTETGRHLLRLLPKDLSVADRADALLTISGIEALTPHSFELVTAECHDVELRAACQRILATIYDGADSLLAMAFVTRMSAKNDVPASTVAERFRTYDAMRVGIGLDALPEGTSEVDDAAFNRTFEVRLDRGELAQARSNLVAAGLSEDEAAARGRRERLAREARLAESMARGPR